MTHLLLAGGDGPPAHPGPLDHFRPVRIGPLYVQPTLDGRKPVPHSWDVRDRVTNALYGQRATRNAACDWARILLDNAPTL